MLVETPYISCHIATKCVHNKRRWSSMYSIEVWSVLSDLGKLCIAGHRFYPCVIPLWWNSNSLHMLVPPCIYIYTRPAAWTKRRIWIFSELTLRKIYGATQEKHQCFFDKIRIKILNQADSSQLSFLTITDHKSRCLGWESICHAADSAWLKPKTYGPMFEQDRQKVWNLQFAHCWSSKGRFT